MRIAGSYGKSWCGSKKNNEYLLSVSRLKRNRNRSTFWECLLSDDYLDGSFYKNIRSLSTLRLNKYLCEFNIERPMVFVR